MTDITLEKVTIPTWADPFPVIVNGKTYYYPAGETLEVPYEVAEVIRQLEREPSLPPSSGGGGSGGSGADILNKYGIIKQEHLPTGYPYSKFTLGTVLDAAGKTVDPDMGMALLRGTINIAIGQEYTVKYNNVEYVCVALDGSEVIGEGSVGLGNIGALTGEGSTDEPFLFATIPANSEMGALGITGVVIPLDGSATVDLEIFGPVENTIPIDEKFLPIKGGAVLFNVELEQPDSSGLAYIHSLEYNYSELALMLANKRWPIAVIADNDRTRYLPIYSFDRDAELITFRQDTIGIDSVEVSLVSSVLTISNSSLGSFTRCDKSIAV